MATDPILTLEDVVAGYGKMTILHGTSFAVQRGTITTVIGPNGAGKSTVFKTVFGLLPARSGRVRFDGADITNLSPRDLIARGLTYVPQGRNIFPELSVRHNLELGGVMAPEGFDLAGRMDAAMDRFPVLRRKAHAQASTLSGGVTVLLIEQNAKRALEASDHGIVLELGRTRIADTAAAILADQRIGQLFLGGGLEGRAG